MKKRNLFLTVSVASVLAVLSAAAVCSEEASQAESQAVPSLQTGAQPQGEPKLESKPLVNENKIFRKKRSEPKSSVVTGDPSPEKPASVQREELKENKSFLGLFSRKKNVKSSAEAVALPQPVQPAPVIEKKSAREEKAALLRKQTMKKARGKADKYISDSKEYYIRGKIEDAETSINQALSVEPMNAEANRFKNKIMLIKGKMMEARRDYSEHCYFKGITHLQENNVFDAAILAGKAVKLNPESEKAKALNANVQDIIQNTAAAMGRSDGRRFKQAIKYAISGDYEKAIGIFRDLQLSYPEMGNYLGYASAHSSDKSNKKRSEDYIDAAIKDIRNERYKHAQENLFQALEMDRANMDAKVMMEQVDVELSAYAPSLTE